MRALAALVVGLLALSFWTNGMDVDVPPRPSSRPRFLRCDHCGERDAFEFCDQCGCAFCIECVPVHDAHVRAV